MAYMDFMDAFEKKIEEEGTDFLTDLLNSLYSEGLVLDGQSYSVRRMSDEIVDDSGETKKVKTGFFCFPQNGEKDRLFQGGAFYIASDLTNVDGKQASFSNPGKPDYVMPDKQVVYYGMVATKARKLLKEQHANSFLFHDVTITTPEGKTELLDGFDFSQHKLFMLGLYGNEYKIGIRERN
ncbi:MAG: hypothetical protein ACI4D6_07690 [Chordicoccus sp.]